VTAPPDTLPVDDEEETPVYCVCGRLLRDAESRRLRLGPVCRKRLASRPARRRGPGTWVAGPHPRAVPVLRPAQLELTWDDGDDDQDDEPAQHITDVPTGALL
jgi:hypothetical protein